MVVCSTTAEPPARRAISLSLVGETSTVLSPSSASGGRDRRVNHGIVFSGCHCSGDIFASGRNRGMASASLVPEK